MDEQNHRIGTGKAVFLIGFALIIDGIQALLTLLLIGVVLNVFFDIIAVTVFSLVLQGPVLKRRTIGMILAAIGEFVPLVNALPLWTAFAIYTVFMDRARETLSAHNPLPRPNRTYRL